jgi:hypothetical protein
MSVTPLPLKPGRAREGKALQKGQQTKAAIVDAALGLATQIGLEGLSIGALAEVTQMSKSGVFAHVGVAVDHEVAAADRAMLGEMHQRTGAVANVNRRHPRATVAEVEDPPA